MSTCVRTVTHTISAGTLGSTTCDSSGIDPIDGCEALSAALNVPSLDKEGQFVKDTASGNVSATDLFEITVQPEIEDHVISDHSRSYEIDATPGINVTT